MLYIVQTNRPVKEMSLLPFNKVQCSKDDYYRWVWDTVHKAENLYKTLVSHLHQDKTFLSLLKKLDKSIEATQKEMHLTGVTDECADCALHGEGTCCGYRTGYKCDSILLLINLFLGRPISMQSNNSEKCFFLTDNGCFLRARPVICVNFVCGRLRNKFPHKQLVHIQEVAGKEIDALFVVEEYIKKYLLLSANL